MTNEHLLLNVLLGGLLGLIGQGLRIVLGLIKPAQNPVTGLMEENKPMSSQLFLSLMIGFIAGALASIIKFPDIIDGKVYYSKEYALGLVAAGYAGADFIEGVMNSVKAKFPKMIKNPKAEKGIKE